MEGINRSQVNKIHFILANRILTNQDLIELWDLYQDILHRPPHGDIDCKICINHVLAKLRSLASQFEEDEQV